MAKFKPARPRTARARTPKAGLPCVILLIAGIALVMLILAWMMASYSPS